MKKKKKMLLAAVLAMTMVLGACGGEASVVSTPGNQGNSGTGASASGSKQESKSSSEQSDGGNMVGKYNIFRFGEGQTAIDGDLLVASGMDKSYLELKADHTGVSHCLNYFLGRKLLVISDLFDTLCRVRWWFLRRKARYWV